MELSEGRNLSICTHRSLSGFLISQYPHPSKDTGAPFFDLATPPAAAEGVR